MTAERAAQQSTSLELVLPWIQFGQLRAMTSLVAPDLTASAGTTLDGIWTTLPCSSMEAEQILPFLEQYIGGRTRVSGNESSLDWWASGAEHMRYFIRICMETL
eukprot:SAG11_NODE_6172_length_1372_cov_0.999214_2_plen_103_part_01